MVDESPAGAAGRPGDPDAAGIVPQRQLNLDVLRHIIKFADGPAVVAACAGVCRLWREGADTAWGTLAQRRWATANKRWRPWEEWLDAGAEYCRSMYRSRHEVRTVVTVWQPRGAECVSYLRVPHRDSQQIDSR